MATWVVGDVHGCARELETLIAELALQRSDTLVCVGDLFHRGPNPAGVMDLLDEAEALFVLGNHEFTVLRTSNLVRSNGEVRTGASARDIGRVDAEVLVGDGGMNCAVPEERRGDVLRFLQRHSGFYLENEAIAGAGETADGRSWCVVHAGIVPGQPPVDTDPMELIRLRRLKSRGRPYWYEVYGGPTLVLFGHTPNPIPRIRRVNGKIVAIGLDTACVYGGKLTAYSPELDEFVSVDAARAYCEQPA